MRWFRLLSWVWVLASPALMLWPFAGEPSSATIEWFGNAFHAVWFALGGAIGSRVFPNFSRWGLWLGLTALGGVLELGQYAVAGRGPSWIDAVLNSVGAAIGLWLPARPVDGRFDRVDGGLRGDKIDESH